MAHTPGPWQALPPDEDCSRWIIVQIAPGNRSYPMYIGSVYTETLGLALDAAANAHLFEAAPEMLAACESHGMSCGLVHDGPELLELAADYLEGVGMHGLVPCLRIKAALERAAIAKAEPD